MTVRPVAPSRFSSQDRTAHCCRGTSAADDWAPNRPRSTHLHVRKPILNGACASCPHLESSHDHDGISASSSSSNKSRREWARIGKPLDDYREANLRDYDGYARTFSSDRARALPDGLPGGLNIAHEALDRHVRAGRGDKLALRWIARDGAIRDLSYAWLGGKPLRQHFGAARSKEGRTRLLAA